MAPDPGALVTSTGDGVAALGEVPLGEGAAVVPSLGAGDVELGEAGDVGCETVGDVEVAGLVARPSLELISSSELPSMDVTSPVSPPLVSPPVSPVDGACPVRTKSTHV